MCSQFSKNQKQSEQKIKNKRYEIMIRRVAL